MTTLVDNLKETLTLGIPQIDDEHQQLFDYLDTLLLSMNTSHGLSRSIEMLKMLEFYAETHFRSEESLMQTYDYPETELHKLEHGAFVDQLKQFRSQIGESDFSPSMTAYLIDWLVNHIQGSDTEFANFIKASPVYLAAVGDAR